MFPKHLHQEYGNRVRLLARGATGAPDADMLGSLASQCRYDRLLQHLESRLVAEKAGNVNGKVVKQLVVFIGVFVQDTGIVGIGFGTSGAQPPADTAGQGALSVMPKVKAPFLVDFLQNTFHFLRPLLIEY